MEREHHTSDWRARIRARRHRKPVLAVQAMAGETAWLDGVVRWREGRLVWETAHGDVAPGPAELALAQRRLYQIAGYPTAARRAFGDADAWLARRQARLELAKLLLSLKGSLPLVAGGTAPPAHPRPTEHLVRALTVEAFCLDPLPVAPSAALLAVGNTAAPVLARLVDDETLPEAARALAALTLGAIAHAYGLEPGAVPRPAALIGSGWLRRAYAWGATADLPPHAPLVVDLLARPDGAALAGRCLPALAMATLIPLPPALLRELLARGTPAATVVALAESIAAAVPVAERLLRRPGELPMRPTERRRAAAQARRERRQAVAMLADLVAAFARMSADPTVIDLVACLADALLDLAAPLPALAEAIAGALRAGLELPPALQAAYLTLLIEHQARLWPRAALKDEAQPAEVVSWLHRCDRGPRYLARMLEVTKDRALVDEVATLGLLRALGSRRWRDPERIRWLVALARDLRLTEDHHLAYTLCRVAECFPKVREGRALVQPLVRAIVTAAAAAVTDGTPSDTAAVDTAANLSQHLLEALLDVAPCTGKGLRASLPLLTGYIPRLMHFAATDGRLSCLCGSLAACALTLEQMQPAHAPEWFNWLLHAVVVPTHNTQEGYDDYALSVSLRLGVCLAAAVAGDDLACFQAIVRAAIARGFDRPDDLLEAGITVLPRFPGLGAAIARIFPRQPRRCANLLTRLGLASRLPAEALAPLAALEPPHAGPAEAATPPDWQALLDDAPDLTSLVTIYRHAQALAGGDARVPAGVTRALAMPSTLAREAAYLERHRASKPNRTDLAARLINLRTRLDDSEALQRAAVDEAAECLRHLTAEAGLAAAEAQMLACFQARLASLAGPLPANFPLDADLLNATLLTLHIRRNRRLLLQLVRAHLAGDRSPREAHPANAAFLQRLAAQGVDTATWLSAYPRRYRYRGMPGNWVHLHLEREPLRILQMGNYFDTCLSLGGFNAFSTVTNAVELNKRVVYATDGAGRVVGRKLIGITAEGRLVGFHTYTSLPDEAGNAALRAIVRRYVAHVAARCGLTLADDGTVPTLFARHWYDDGVVPWDDGLAVAADSAQETRRHVDIIQRRR